MTLERMLSLLSIIISMCALVVAVWLGVDNRSFNKLSVKPHLQINPNLSSITKTGLYIENAGTGTAFIDIMTLSVKGKTFDVLKEGSTALLEFLDIKTGCFQESWPRKGAAIQPGREFPLLLVSQSNAEVCYPEAVKFLIEPNVTMNISYETPYEQTLLFSESISLTKRELGIYFDMAKKLSDITRTSKQTP